MVRYASPAVGQVLGLDPRGVAGNASPVYVHPEDGVWTRDAFTAPGRGARRPSYELRARRADGSWRWFEPSPTDAATELLDSDRG